MTSRNPTTKCSRRASQKLKAIRHILHTIGVIPDFIKQPQESIPIIMVMKMIGNSISIIKLIRQPINVGGCFAYLRGLLIAARVR